MQATICNLVQRRKRATTSLPSNPEGRQIQVAKPGRPRHDDQPAGRDEVDSDGDVLGQINGTALYDANDRPGRVRPEYQLVALQLNRL